MAAFYKSAFSGCWSFLTNTGTSASYFGKFSKFSTGQDRRRRNQNHYLAVITRESVANLLRL